MKVRRSLDQNNAAPATEAYGNPTFSAYTSTARLDLPDADTYAPNRRAEATKREPDSTSKVRPQRGVRIDVPYPYLELHATSVNRTSDPFFLPSGRCIDQ
jgi:hypothetical protein